MRERLLGWWPTVADQPVPVTLAGAVVPIVICALCGALRAQVSAASATLLLVLVVVAAAVTGIRLAALAAALSGGLWFDFFLTVPRHSFAIASPNDVAVVLLLVVIGAVVSELVHWALRQQTVAARRAGYLEGARQLAEAAARGELSGRELVDLVAGQIGEVLGVSRCEYVVGRVYDVRIARLGHDGRLERAGRPIDVDRRGLPTDELVAVEVHRGSEVVGHFLISSANRVARPTLEQRRVVGLLADLVAGSHPTRAGA